MEDKRSLQNKASMSEAKEAGRRPGFFGRLFREQKEQAFNESHKRFLSEIWQQYKDIASLKKKPVVVESFEEAVERNSLTDEFLKEQFLRFRRAQFTIYAIAVLLFVYAVYFSATAGLIWGLGVFVASIGAAINGYLNGFRAWQIKHRNLIRLQDAIWIPGTYWVV
jgi:hypothetical protein